MHKDHRSQSSVILEILKDLGLSSILSAAQATWYLKSPASDVEQTFAESVKTKTKKCPLLDNAINYLFLVVKNLGAMKL